MDEMKDMGTGDNLNNNRTDDRMTEGEASSQPTGQAKECVTDPAADKMNGQTPEQYQINADKLNFNRSDRLMAAGALLFGTLFVCLFYGKYPGISVPIFIIAFYALLFAYARPVLTKNAKFGWFLSIPVFLISLTYALYGNETLMILDILALPVLILLQTLLITGVNTFKWHSPGIIIDIIYGMIFRCLLHVFKPIKLLASLFKRKSNDNGKRSAGFRVLIGLAISVPLLLIIFPLLSSADMVFGRFFDKLFKIFENVSLGEVIGKINIALVIFFLSFSYLWSLGHKERVADGVMKGIIPKTPEQKRCWDPVTIITMTAIVDILYVVFVAIQFAYLFGSYGLPQGFTYAEYARRGFSELILVSLLNIALLAVTLTYTQKGALGVNIALRILNSIMVGCTIVMLVSAYYRMTLYEEAYGFTFLRIMTTAFMFFLLVIFVITLGRVWIDKLPLLKPYIVAAVVAFTVINYINADEMIAKNNIERYYNTKKIDMEYFRSLSCSVVDDLKVLAKDRNTEVSARAAEMLAQRKDVLARLNKDWQSFNLTNYLAQKDLEKGW